MGGPPEISFVHNNKRLKFVVTHRSRRVLRNICTYVVGLTLSLIAKLNVHVITNCWDIQLGFWGFKYGVKIN